MTEPRSHDDLRMSGSAEIWIDAPPDVVYAAVSDLPRMGEWSPENRGGEWIDTDHAVVGATFRGHNENARGAWETIATVDEAEPGASFAFTIAAPGFVGITWRYGFRPERDGTLVTEGFDWYWSAFPNDGFRGRVGKLPLDEAIAAVAERQQHLQEGIVATLAALKRALER